MDTVLRAAAVYTGLLLLVRVSGRRTLGQFTAFDFILLLILSEAVQNALTADDRSLTGAAVAVVTLVGIDIALSHLKQRFPALGAWIDGLPVVLVDRGHPRAAIMARARISEHDILAAAREHAGLERMEDIRYAVLEADGTITVVPAPRPEPPTPRARPDSHSPGHT